MLCACRTYLRYDAMNIVKEVISSYRNKREIDGDMFYPRSHFIKRSLHGWHHCKSCVGIEFL